METNLSNLNELFHLEEQDIRSYSPLTLAYIGDGIYELIIRTILVKKGNCPVNRLHKKASSLVKAAAQSGIMEIIEKELTPEELRCVDKLFILDGCQDGPVRTIAREARKKDTIINYVSKERLDQLSETRAHQGVIAQVAAYEYSTVEEILEKAEEKGEPPFLVLLDNVEDPHNLGAIIRTANLAGAHGVIIPKRRSVGLTSTVAKTSAGALNYTPVAKVTNLVRTIEELKEKGIWFVCADMGGESMYRLNLTGPIGMIVGNETLIP